MSRITVVLVAWVLVGCLSSLAWAQEATDAKPASSTAVLLEKGIYTEETVGDIGAAIKIYKQVVEQVAEASKYASQAQYRLGMCYLKEKQNQQAIQVFNQIIQLYPDQDDLIQRARKRLVQARGRMSKAEVAKIVEDAVKTISTRAEGDPEVARAIQSVDDLNDESVVKELAKWLDSDTKTIRRSAIYILWQGRFDEIDAAAPALKKLLSHEKALTRGMAALALGGKQVPATLDAIINVTLNDKDDYARRCAAYALGLLGNPAAEPALKKALKDSNALVRNNAETALTMLSQKTEAADNTTQHISATTQPTSASSVQAVAIAGTFLSALQDNDIDRALRLLSDDSKVNKSELAQFPPLMDFSKARLIKAHTDANVTRVAFGPTIVKANRKRFFLCLELVRDGTNKDSWTIMDASFRENEDADDPKEVMSWVGDANPTAAQGREGVKVALRVAEPWLKLVDEGKYDESWDAAAAYFQKAVPKETWRQQLPVRRLSPGSHESSPDPRRG